MCLGPLLGRLHERVELQREDGDSAYFHALTVELEYLTKIVTAAVIACLGDDFERSRYSLEHKLVRADSLGQWNHALTQALIGPPAQRLRAPARPLTRELTERVAQGDWRYGAVEKLCQAGQVFGLDTPIGPKTTLRRLFEVSVAIRNRTRGHGHPTTSQCRRSGPLIADAIASVTRHLGLLRIPWAHLHRNLSGKYRVTPLQGRCSPFDYLKSTRTETLADGVYIWLDEPVHVALVFTDPDVTDILLPNGNFRGDTFEALSYITNDTCRIDAASWSTPPGSLPPSETHGAAGLEQVGNTFANLPPLPTRRIPRPSLEQRLRQELMDRDRHPIISLTGPGGIGKTTLALAVVHAIAGLPEPPYPVVLWMSARDIDLMDAGPKPVQPRVVTKEDIARTAVELLEPAPNELRDLSATQYFELCLREGAAGPTLFVFDNFETLDTPADIFRWIDTHIRPSNKALITTRFRDFAGDYPLVIGGMTEEEAEQLINVEAERLDVSHLLSSQYRKLLISESEGHPYVIKILLGRVAHEGRAVKPQRIVASADRLLEALFERTYDNLSPAAQRMFLLLASWRVFVPQVAVEAVSLRPGNERFDAREALRELGRFSLIDEITSEADGEVFIGVPLAAASYGRRKLEVSPFKVAVEEDRKLLMEFGAGKREDAHRGVLPRIERLAKVVAQRATTDGATMQRYRPILEYLAGEVPRAYLLLSKLIMETDDSVEAVETAKRYVIRFLEKADPRERPEAWMRLAELCAKAGDTFGEVHALAEAALLPTMKGEVLSMIANRINNRIRELKGQRIEKAWSEEVKALIVSVAETMERSLGEASATDCSRLAWLWLNVNREDKARQVVKRGLAKDPEDYHCGNLARKLGM